VRRKREICAYYADTIGDLPGISLMPEAPWGRATHWLTCITVDPARFGATREENRLARAREDIESRPLWKPPPYPRPRGKCVSAPPNLGGQGGARWPRRSSGMDCACLRAQPCVPTSHERFRVNSPHEFHIFVWRRERFGPGATLY
jgi:hypothetical protein